MSAAQLQSKFAGTGLGMAGKGLFGLGGKEFSTDQLVKDLMEDKNSGYLKRVQDAIIKPNGGIITTSPNDTLIATRAPVQRGTEQGIIQTSNSITSALANQKDSNDKVVNAINTLVDIMKNINTTVKDNFGIDNLRFSHVYGDR